MRKHIIILSALALIACCGCSGTAQQVYYNAQVYTADQSLPEATAFVVEGDKIVFVGDDAAAAVFAGRKADRIDLGGKRVLPGLSDTHCHYFMLSTRVTDMPTISLDSHENHEQTLERIKDFDRKYSKEQVPVIYGFGWGFSCNPVASELDKLGIERPVLILACDGHTAWVNSASLKALGVDRNYKDIAPGASFFERDAEGNPTGKIVETTQEFWATQNLGIFTPEGVQSGMKRMTEKYNALGVTSLYDAGALVISDEMALQAAAPLKDNTMRLYTSMVYDGTEGEDDFLARAKKLRGEYATALVHPTTVKSFKDGTKEVATAYMYRPYPDGSYGNCLFSTAQHVSIMSKAAAAGFNIHIHAIGDRALNETLDVMAGLGDIQGTKTIAHNEIICEEAMAKYCNGCTDVFFQTTPAWWAIPVTPENVAAFGVDKDYADYYIQHRFPIRTVRDAGVTVTFGSDAPASDGMNPLYEMWAATSRGVSRDFGETMDQNFTVAECVDACTINAARQYGAEDEFGSITEGKYADFVVLDKDIFTIPTQEIKDTKVIATYFGGKQIYKAE